MTSLLLDAVHTPKDRDDLEGIKFTAYSLLHLLNDILDFSKIEAGKLDLFPVVFSVRDTVNGVTRSLRIASETKGLRLRTKVCEGAPAYVLGDDMRLRQVLLNLVNNAIKFTAAGQVLLTVDAIEGKLLFSISDTGMGIPPDRQEAVFQPFRQADGTTARKFGGTGLGLSISRRLVELMGGRIWVESPNNTEGTGTTFHFAVTMAAAVRPEAPAGAGGAEPDLPPLHILLAEDNRVNQKVAVRLLEKEGHVVAVADDGAAALELLACNDGPPFDCILMDVQMPGMDGLEATRRLRAGGNRIPVIALTANAMKGDQDECMAAGMNGYVGKPFEMAALRAELRACLLRPAVSTEFKIDPLGRERAPGGRVDGV